MNFKGCAAAVFVTVASSNTAGAGAFVTPQLLLEYSAKNGLIDVFDYRPAINADASRIVFERQLPDGKIYSSHVVLFTSSLSQQQPQPLLNSMQFPTSASSTRPDWCQLSSNSPIVFSASGDSTASTGVFSIVPDGKSSPVQISNNPN